MTPLGKVREHIAHDPRARGAGKTAADQASQFDSVLSDVGADAKGGAAKPAGNKRAADTANAADAKSLDALIGKIADDAEAGVGAPDLLTDKTVSTMDGLSKRTAAKDDAASSEPASTIAALLFAGGAPQIFSPPSAATGKPSTAAQDKVRIALASRDIASANLLIAEGKTLPAKTDATTVADVAIATHLAVAPTAPSQGKTAPPEGEAADASSNASNDASATQVVTSAAAGGAAAHHDRDADASADHGRPFAPTVQPDPSAAGAPSIGSGAHTSLATTIKAAATRAAASPDAEAAKPVATLAKTLTLQLSQADLGTVDVKMHMAGDGLDVRLIIADQQTLGIVSRERDALTSALQGTSVALHSLVIQDGGAAAQPGGHHASQGHSSGAGQSGGQSSGHSAGGRGEGAQAQAQRQRPDTLEAIGSGSSTAVAGGGALVV